MIYLITPWNIKIMETAVKVKYFFINMEFGHHLPVTQIVSFLEQTDVSNE
jgi:hypothetical protein